MAAVNWKNPVNGDWDVAADWSTGEVPTSADDVTISATGPYIVTVGAPMTIGVVPLRLQIFPTANSLTFNAPEAALDENTGKLTVAGALTVNSGLVSLNEANAIGSVSLTGGVLSLGNAGALGTAIVLISGGELLGAATEALNNSLEFSGTSTIAAAHGTTLNVTGNFGIGSNSTLNFGAPGEDGIIIWNPLSYSNGIPFTFNIVAGTLKAASADLAAMMDTSDEPTTVDAGATLDLGGFGLTLSDLVGAGAVADSGAAATLILDTANFSGAISGPLSLGATGPVVLSGANTYTGTTTISSAGNLLLGDGGATGLIGSGEINDAGTLTIDRNNAVTLTNAISGAGVLKQIGTGVTSINTANPYTGGTTVSAGTLVIGAADELGTGAIGLDGGELLTTANETVIDALNFSGTSTIAAAHGTTLDLNGAIGINGNST
ncbi:MAG: hypothetical protein JOY52_19535, partial [Hyphomicrobiales bacterium]|nr:hypothetical protein [Hyphomicrobiales bacterium]